MSNPQDLRALADEILELHEAGDLQGALTQVDVLLQAADHYDPFDPVVRESMFAARFTRALVLTDLEELELAAAAYQEAASTPADLDDPDQRHEVAMALLNRGVCLDAVGDHATAVEAYDEVVARFHGADDPVTADQVLRARVNRAAALLAAGQVEQALAATDALLDELDPELPSATEQRAMTLRLRAVALRALGQVPDALEALDAVARLPADDPAARLQVVAADQERAELLVELGRPEEAVALLDAAVTRTRQDPDPAVADATGELLAALATLRDQVGADAAGNAHRSRPPA